jgi:Actin
MEPNMTKFGFVELLEMRKSQKPSLSVILFYVQYLREQLVQLMFETFNVSGLYASEQAVLSLYAVGRISGCTIDIGHGKIGMLSTKLQSTMYCFIYFEAIILTQYLLCLSLHGLLPL